jgi:hypothetical protein
MFIVTAPSQATIKTDSNSAKIKSQPLGIPDMALEINMPSNRW